MTKPEQSPEGISSSERRLFKNPSQLGRRMLVGALLLDVYINSFFLADPQPTNQVPTELEQIVGEVIRYHIESIESED